MRTKVAVAATVVLVVVAIVWWRTQSADEEAPIRVKNGSMTIDTEDGTWQADGGAWSNETVKKEHKGELWVRVNLTSGTTCKGSGHPVQIEYSDVGFKAMFNVVGNPPRTKVGPKGQLDRDGDKRLKHGASGEYITGVKINGSALNCDITQNNLDVINICSSAANKECQ
jgi:hypothetical protein